MEVSRSPQPEGGLVGTKFAREKQHQTGERNSRQVKEDIKGNREVGGGGEERESQKVENNNSHVHRKRGGGTPSEEESERRPARGWGWRQTGEEIRHSKDPAKVRLACREENSLGPGPPPTPQEPRSSKTYLQSNKTVFPFYT